MCPVMCLQHIAAAQSLAKVKRTARMTASCVDTLLEGQLQALRVALGCQNPAFGFDCIDLEFWCHSMA